MVHRKPNLPQKVCPACGRPFAWRKRWRNNWERVVYCSRRCAGTGRARPHLAGRTWPAAPKRLNKS